LNEPSLSLAALAQGLRAARPGDDEARVRRVTVDSRRVEPGTVFVACRGATPRSRDGHDFAAAAVAKGAVAVVVEDLAAVEDIEGAGVYVVPDSRLAAAELAERLWGEPSRRLSLVGLTGTNGKTTVSFLLADVLNAAGLAASMFGTLGVGHRGALRSSGFTTPEAEVVSEELARLVASGEGAVAMEVSSHALATERVAGLRFAVSAFTNLSQDHLDFHASMEEYFEAKALLFEQRLLAGPAVLPDRAGRWEEALRARCPEVLLYGRSEAARVRLLEEELSPQGLRLRLTLDGEEGEVASPLLGAPNVENLLCAAGCALALGLAPARVFEGLRAARPVPGRFEPIEGGGEGRAVVIVDYAHTPDALSRLLAAARGLAPGRVIAVFGCGGDRDTKKRPLMGRAAAEGADMVVLTDDNPRSEDPGAILDAVEDGLTDPWVCVAPDLLFERSYSRVHNRRAAIAAALRASRAGDIVVLAGKGHESTQTVGDRVLPFDDAAVARELLAEAL
jgi:UDP-N-acetylmuramoyl-L-alanyl-D-glutamate--2,6-diaminopimelate ligase